MLPSAVTTVVVVLSVLGAVAGGWGPSLPGGALDGADEHAVGPSAASFGSTDSTADALLQAATASVVFEDQTSDGRSVTVASVTLPEGGFVTIHDEGLVNGEPFRSIRGTSTYLDPGSYRAVTVDLATPITRTQRLVAVPYRDTDADQVYDYVSTRGREDVPYESARGVVVSDVATVDVNVPPTAALQFSPIDPRPGETVVFDGDDSEDSDGVIVSYEWVIRDANSNLVAFGRDDAPTFLHAFRAVGVFDVTLTVTDDDGATDAAGATVVVRENTPPTARFEFTPVDPEIGEEVRFDGSVSTDDRGVVTYLWDLDGDGRFETRGSRVARTYDTPGRYPVTLLVSDGEGETDRTSLTVTVSEVNTPPVALFDILPGAPLVGEEVEFDASDSFDSDPGDAVVFYRWEVDGVFVGDGDAPWLFYEFPQPGVHDVTLTVTDDHGAIGRATERVVVDETIRPPTARLEFSPPVPTVGTTVTFDATGSTDDGEILTYRWDLDGDDSFESTGPVVERRYSEGGTFVVALLVVDDDQETDTATTTVRVNEPPEPTFRIDPGTPRVGEPVTLDASRSTDDRRIVSYAWDLDGDEEIEATGPVVGHEFETAGIRVIRLTVTDDDGATTRTTRTLTVERSSVTERDPSSPGEEPSSDGDETGSSVTDPDTGRQTSTPVSPPGRSGWPLPGSPGDAAAAGGVVVVAGLVVLFRDEIAVLLRGLELPRQFPRTTPRPGGRPRPARNVLDPDETEDHEPNQPPIASIRHAPDEPVVNRPIRFDGLRSTDPDGRVVSYRWSLGEALDRTGPTIVHTFEEAGEHAVTLTVTDDDGATGEETVTIEVEPGEGELALVDVHPDAPGRRHLQQEYLTFGNVGDGPLDVEGWTVHDAAEAEGRTVREGDHAFTFTDVPELAPEATLTLHTGEEPADGPGDTEDQYHRYWGRTWFAVWNDDADVVVVKDDLGNPVLAARYRRTDDGYTIEPLDPERFEYLFPEVE